MPNIKSAIKRVRVGERNRVCNQTHRSALRTAIKKANLALEDNTDNKVDIISDAIRKLDSAAGKGIIHKNKAARKKSQLVTALNKAN